MAVVASLDTQLRSFRHYRTSMLRSTAARMSAASKRTAFWSNLSILWMDTSSTRSGRDSTSDESPRMQSKRDCPVRC